MFILKSILSRPHEKGIALLGVLWLIAFLSVLALGTLSLLENDSQTARLYDSYAEAQGLADAGVFLTVHALCNIKTAQSIPVDGHTRTLRFNDHDIAVSVQDENGKIDINFAPPQLLKSLILSVGASATEADQISHLIEQTRKSPTRSDNSASVFSIHKLSFLAIEQLQSIRGITSERFALMRNALTVYSQQPTVQVATAPKEVLEALPGIDNEMIKKVLADRELHPITATHTGMTEAISAQDSAHGTAFTIVSKAEIAGNSYIRRAIVLITGDLHRPYKILEWTQDIGDDKQ